VTGLQANQTLLVIYVLVFVGVLVAFEGLRQFLTRGETAREARNRRMKMIARGATSKEVLDQLMRPGAARSGLARHIPDLARHAAPGGA
jgi:tight adherence protein B